MNHIQHPQNAGPCRLPWLWLEKNILTRLSCSWSLVLFGPLSGEFCSDFALTNISTYWPRGKMGPDPEGADCFLGGRRTLRCPSSKQGVRGSWGFPGSASGKETACQCRRHKKPQVRSLGREDPLEEGMAAHSSILAWRIPMDREAWWATVHGVSESDTTEATEHKCTHPDIVLLCIGSSLLGSQASCLGPCHSRPCLVASTTIFRT